MSGTSASSLTILSCSSWSKPSVHFGIALPCFGPDFFSPFSGNRFGQPKAGAVFDRIAELHLNGTLLAWDEVSLNELFRDLFS